MQFTTFYTVQTLCDTFGQINGDCQTDRDAAYTQFAECLDDDQPAMAIRINLHPKTGEHIGSDDVTQEFRAEYQRISIERGYGDPFEEIEPTARELWACHRVAELIEDQGAAA